MVLILFFEFVLLFLLSRILTTSLSQVFYKIFKSKKVTIIILAIIFLPGTIIHELSHLLIANLLFVRTHDIEFIPKLDGKGLKLGSVQIEKTDTIRNFFIGVSPFLVGTTILLLILFYSFDNKLLGFNLLTLFVLYFIFTISNTMYSSRKDMEGAIEFVLIIVIPIIFLYFLGVRVPGISFSFFESQTFKAFLRNATLFLSIPITLDIVIILLSKFIMKSSLKLDLKKV